MDEIKRGIAISGFWNPGSNEEWELITAGGEAKLGSICAFSYSVDHIPECLALIDMIKNSLKESYEAENAAIARRLYGERLNRQMIRAGHKPFSQKKLDIICDANMLL